MTSYSGANLTITTAALAIAADDKSKFAGEVNPAFTASYSGLQFAQTPTALSGSLQFFTPATVLSTVGNYAVIPFGLSSSNYAISYVSGNLRIDPENLKSTTSLQSVLSNLNLTELQRVRLPDTSSYTTGTPIVFTQAPLILSDLNRINSLDDINSLPVTAAGPALTPIDRSPRLLDSRILCNGGTPMQAFSCR